MTKIVKRHRKPPRSKFHFFSSFANSVCCELCNLLQSAVKYILSFLKLWKYFEQNNDKTIIEFDFRIL